jgi:protein pelota
MNFFGAKIFFFNFFFNSKNRSSDIATRKKYVALVESVKAAGGEVKIFSTFHVSGERK